jgi:hypothetical protein
MSSPLLQSRDGPFFRWVSKANWHSNVGSANLEGSRVASGRLLGARGHKTKPNEAKQVKVSVLSEMREKFRKRSQMSYRPHYQRLTAKNGPFFEKNECDRIESRSGDPEARGSAKTNCPAYHLDYRPLRSILAKRTVPLNPLILMDMILKNLKRLIRCAELSAISRHRSAKSKTNWHGHVYDSEPLDSISTKRTGRLNPLILNKMILKTLKRFIRCEKLSAISRQRSAKSESQEPKATFNDVFEWRPV